MPADANTQKTWVPSSRLLTPVVALKDEERMMCQWGVRGADVLEQHESIERRPRATRTAQGL
jgi:hypothetical protein